MRRCRLCVILPIVLLILIAGSCVLEDCLRGAPERFADPQDHFKYGSIGSDNLRRGIPYRIFRVLPVLFADLLNDAALVPPNRREGYGKLGIIQEEPQPIADGLTAVEYPRPIGFSKRRILGMDVVGINCAFCHVSTIREAQGKKPTVILRMPANGLYAESFFRFLARAGNDPRFTAEKILAKMKEQDPEMAWYEVLLYQQIIIPGAKASLENLGRHLAFLEEPLEDGTARPRFGPGRVETWAIYKILTLQHAIPLIDLLPDVWSLAEDLDPRPGVGFADFPAIWKTKPTNGPFHWDGNNPSLPERNTIAGMGAGITPPSRDDEGLERVTLWIEQAPPEAFNKHAPKDHRVDARAAPWKHGRQIYAGKCAFCHELPAEKRQPMAITSIAKIGTDRARLDSFTMELVTKLNMVGSGYPWRLQEFTKTKGYANMTLAGIWLRAPYLHNGSVPTLRDLLNKASERPTVFYRGDDVYDWKKGGFRSTARSDGAGTWYFEYETGRDGNSNAGHEGGDYGTELQPGEKEDLLAYLKTL
jgi:hypothetical protein